MDILGLKKANCKSCHKCIRVCPVKSIEFSGQQAKIIGSECILKVASAAFGVYLLHDNYLIRYLVWDFFHASKVARTHFAVIYAVAIAV